MYKSLHWSVLVSCVHPVGNFAQRSYPWDVHNLSMHGKRLMHSMHASRSVEHAVACGIAVKRSAPRCYAEPRSGVIRSAERVHVPRGTHYRPAELEPAKPTTSETGGGAPIIILLLRRNA